MFAEESDRDNESNENRDGQDGGGRIHRAVNKHRDDAVVVVIIGVVVNGPMERRAGCHRRDE